MSDQNFRTANLSSSKEMSRFFWPAIGAAQAIHVAASLGLADLVADGPKTADELAQATKAHGPSLRRLLRALTSLGVFAENAVTEIQFVATHYSTSWIIICYFVRETLSARC